GAEQQYGSASESVREPTPYGREYELRGGIGSADDRKHPGARAEIPAVERDQRHNDAEADKVDKDGQENNENGRALFHDANASNARPGYENTKINMLRV